MAPKTTKRRSPGEGGAFSYKIRTKTADPADKGVRWYWKAVITGPDGIAKPKVKRGFMTKQAALDDMRDALVASGKGGFTEPSKQTLGGWLDEWAAGLRLSESTKSSYRKNIRLHVQPYPVAQVKLASLTPPKLAAHYQVLEKSGRKDYRAGEGLSARTVRYIHTIIGAALSEAVSAGMLAKNPATDPKQSKPPTAQQAEAPEMHPWTADQLRAFLGWARENNDLYAAWWTLAYTGMRRGELLALRWRDIDLDSGMISIQRTVGVVRNKGERAQILEKVPKTKRSRRVIDIDPLTVALLRSWKKERGTLALALARDDAVVFGDLEGGYRHPERFWRAFKSAQRQCAKALGDGAPPEISIHDLRHTHATLLLADREPPKTVSERLGHASITVTLAVYGHVMPGDQKRAADRFAALIREA